MFYPQPLFLATEGKNTTSVEGNFEGLIQYCNHPDNERVKRDIYTATEGNLFDSAESVEEDKSMLSVNRSPAIKFGEWLQVKCTKGNGDNCTTCYYYFLSNEMYAWYTC